MRLAEYGLAGAMAVVCVGTLAWVISRLTWVIDRHWRGEPTPKTPQTTDTEGDDSGQST